MNDDRNQEFFRRLANLGNDMEKTEPEAAVVLLLMAGLVRMENRAMLRVIADFCGPLAKSTLQMIQAKRDELSRRLIDEEGRENDGL